MFLKDPNVLPKYDKKDERRRALVRASIDLYRTDETYVEDWEDAYMFFRQKVQAFLEEQ